MGYSVTLKLITVLVVSSFALALDYPPARRDEKVEEEFFGTKVKDPYRWLERPNSNEVAEYVDAQNDLSFNYVTDCPERQQIRERLTELWKYPKYGKPEKRGSRYFYYAQQSGREVVYVQEERNGSSRAILDSEETGALIFPHLGVSRDGEVLVYRELIKRKSGSPKLTGNLRIKNITSDHLYPDLIEDIRYPQIAWTRDSSGFFYFSHRLITSPPKEDDDPTSPIIYIYYHRLGNQQSQDALVFDFTDFHKDPSSAQLDFESSEDGQYLLLRQRIYNDQPQARRPNSIYIGDLNKFESNDYTGKLQFRPVVTSNSNLMKYVTNIGNLFYFRSKVAAKNFRLIEIDVSKKGEDRERVVVEENRNYILQSASAVAPNKVVLGYTSDAAGSYAEIRELGNGTLLRMFPLKFGELLSFSSEIGNPEVLFRSQTLEGLPYLTSLDTSKEKSAMEPLVPMVPLTSYDPSLFTSTKVSYPIDGDGETEEMVIIHRKDIVMDGSNYVFLVEREFEIDFYFRMFFSYMKDYNAVIAIPNVQEADGTYKDSALEDFIAAAQYLIKNGYTSSSKLISRGTGVFGLFVAAATNRNPDLFSAIVPYMVGFDMVRFPTFSNWSVAATPSDKETFQRLLGVSPLHNVRLPANESVQYPAILIPTPDNEFPVIFAFKYIAELQYKLGRNSRQTNPFLLRVVSEPSENLRNFARYHIDRETDIRCFLGKTVGLKIQSQN